MTTGRFYKRTYMMIAFIVMLCIILSTGCRNNAPKSDNDDGRISVYYNSPLIYEWPQGKTKSDVGKALIELIDSSQESIDFALYGLEAQDDVLDALKDALERGVVVRGVVDKDVDDRNFYDDTQELIDLVGDVKTDYLTDVETLKNKSTSEKDSYWPSPEGFKGSPQMVGYSLKNNEAIIAVHASRNESEFDGQIMHHKFLIVDAQKVWTGSTNVSSSGTGGFHANIACIINDRDIADIYAKEFDQMYEDGLFHKEKETLVEPKTIIFDDDTEIGVYFSPQDDAVFKAIQPLIEEAKESIDLPVYYLTNKYITADLIKAHNRGVKVRIIIDATSAGSGYTKHEILRQAGIQVKVENWSGKMHMKTMIVDDEYLVIGSMNFTAAGNNTNDENTLVIRNTDYAKEAGEFFDSLWDSIPHEFVYRNPVEVQLPPYKIVPKMDGYNLIKGVENKSGLMIYLLPNDEYYNDYLVNKENEFYFPSVQEAREAGFVAFDYDIHR